MNQIPEHITLSAEGKIADENALDFVGFDVTADALQKPLLDDAKCQIQPDRKNAYLDDKLR